MYYCERYISEIGQGNKIPYVEGCLLGEIRAELSRYPDRVQTVDEYDLKGDLDVLIGNVSSSSKKFHKKHLEAMRSGVQKVSLISPLDCSDELLELWRSRHPLSECRSWCNIVIGVKAFALGEALSGFDAIKSAYENSKASAGPKLSLHQRELQQAIKLLLLSAKNGDFGYGINYLIRLMAQKSKSTKSVIRTLRCYRLLSYMYDEFVRLMRSGEVTVGQMNAIENETITREKLKYKYHRQSEVTKPTIEDYSDINAVIEASMDDLFAGLENYALAMAEGENAKEETVDTTATVSQMDLTFDIGIQDQVEMMIAKLGLQESSVYGFIDIGDDMIGADEDW
jgi:hypothetical protein